MVATTNLKAYYKLDETTGTTVNDAHGSNDGTNNGATVNQSGKINTSYYFNGSSDYINLGNSIFSGNLTAFTFNTWIYWDGSDDNQILSNYWDGSSRSFSWYPRYDAGASGKMALFASFNGGSSASTYVSTGTPTANAWNMVTVILNSGTLYFYINGSAAGTATAGTTMNMNTADIYAAKTNFNGGGANYFNGKIDELSIWERALSSTEVSDLYNSGDGLAYPLVSTTTVQVNKTGNSRILIPDNQETKTGTARILINDEENVYDGVARLKLSESKTKTGTARVKVQEEVTKTGTASIRLGSEVTKTGNASILLPVEQRTKPGNARILFEDTEITKTGTARVLFEDTEITKTGNARISSIDNQITKTGNASISLDIQIKVEKTGNAYISIPDTFKPTFKSLNNEKPRLRAVEYFSRKQINQNDKEGNASIVFL